VVTMMVEILLEVATTFNITKDNLNNISYEISLEFSK
jgi:hypothetical protein